MLVYLILANGLLSSTYGWGENNCGDIGKAVPCQAGAITASGIKLDHSSPQAAIAVPKNYRLKATYIRLRIEGGKCTDIHLVDKMNPRYIGKRGFDLTPKALHMLGVKGHRDWTGKIYVCNIQEVIAYGENNKL
jgi:hypothetical protein